MKNKQSKENTVKCLVVSLCLILTGCGTIGLAHESDFESAFENGQEKEPIDIYTSESRAVLESVNAEEGTITVYRIKERDEETLFYDRSTSVSDKYGSSLVMEQLSPGEILTIRYSSELRRAGSVATAQDAWSYDGISKYEINEGRGTLQVGSDTYKIDKDIRIFSGDEIISPDQILKQDEISLKGIGHEVASIVVEKGHGYLKLQDEEALIGGWIEVGQAVIQQISQNMLLTVPEGSYTVRLSADTINETREVIVERNKETVLGLGDIEVPQPVNGRVVFSVYPEKADIYVDGMSINTSYTLLMPFGLHQITASAEGFDTISEYFNVEGETTNVKLSLTTSGEKGSNTVSGNSVKDKGYHTITVKEPEGVEVYEDNLYMGIVPATFEKKPGSHTITLRKEGYITRSYQIEVTEDDRDLVYTFPALEKDENPDKSTVSGNTVSGNTVSGNEAKSNGEKTTVSGNEGFTEKNN